MRLIKKVVALVVAAFILGAMQDVGLASSGGAGQAGAYLKLGVGARPLGMGGAFVAIADDGTATYWNPAGLAGIRMREISTMHAVLSLDRSFDFINYVAPVRKFQDRTGFCRKSAWGFSWIKFGVDGIPEVLAPTDPANPTPGTPFIKGYFEDSENAYTGTWAWSPRDRLKLGLNISYFTHELYTNSADGAGLDLGAIWNVDEKLDLGATLKNIGASMKWDTASGRKDDFPLAATVGAAYRIKENTTLALDINKTENLKCKAHFGIETWVNKSVGLRAGASGSDLSFGASFRNEEWRFDYAFADQELGDIHRISASRRF